MSTNRVFERWSVDLCINNTVEIITKTIHQYHGAKHPAHSHGAASAIRLLRVLAILKGSTSAVDFCRVPCIASPPKKNQNTKSFLRNSSQMVENYTSIIFDLSGMMAQNGVSLDRVMWSRVHIAEWRMMFETLHVKTINWASASCSVYTGNIITMLAIPQAISPVVNGFALHICGMECLTKHLSRCFCFSSLLLALLSSWVKGLWVQNQGSGKQGIW